MTRYRCTFERVGRRRDVQPLDVVAASPDELAEQVHRAIARFLLSRDTSVTVDLESGEGRIFAGFRNGGSFTIEES